MGDHPRPAGRKAFCSPFVSPHEPRGSAQAARAAGPVGIAQRRQRAGGVRATLIGGMCNPRLRRHGRAIRRGENDARRACLALRTIGRQLVFRHRSYLREGPAIPAEIFVDRHDVLLGDLQLASALRGGTLHAAALRSFEALVVRRRRDIDSALDVLDGAGRARHHVELEDVGRKPQRGAGIGNIDDSGNVALHRRGSEDRIGLRL